MIADIGQYEKSIYKHKETGELLELRRLAPERYRTIADPAVYFTRSKLRAEYKFVEKMRKPTPRRKKI